ncbi:MULTISPECIES: Ig-like domain-containing protein [unclassified Pseudoxanthomonas]|uniref:Ig-like domain-containing protein n=1 Tax=unclassified Pseudoxanthomonas TaxID=2645906 RepID=UPI0030771AD0
MNDKDRTTSSRATQNMEAPYRMSADINSVELASQSFLADSLSPDVSSAQTPQALYPPPRVDYVYDDQFGLPIAHGGTTYDSTPALTGTVRSGVAQVAIYANDELIGYAKVLWNGKWTFIAPHQDNGEITFTVAAADINGRIISAPSEPTTIAIEAADHAGPPNIYTIADNSAGNTVIVEPGGETSDATPTLHGRSELGTAKVAIYVNGELSGYAETYQNGAWEFTLPPQNLGPIEITVTALNASGQPISVPSDPIALEITGANHHEPPRIDSVYDDQAYQQIGPGGNTFDDTPTLRGRADIGVAKVAVFVNGELVGYADTSPNGQWYFNLPSQGAGPVELTTIAANASGGFISLPSDPIAFEIKDANHREPPRIDSLYDDQAYQQIRPGSSTYDDTPSLNGRVGVGVAKVAIFVNGELVGYANANQNGNWNFQLPSQGVGPVELTTIATDASGRFISAPSDPIAFEIKDVIHRESPRIDSLYDDQAFQQIRPGSSTHDDTPSLNGRVGVGIAKVAVLVNGELVGYANVNQNGNWSFQLPSQGAGPVELTTIATDASGRFISAPSDPIAFEIKDPSHREPPRIDTVYDDQAHQQIGHGGSTRDDTPTLSGRANSGVAKVAVFVNGELAGYADVKIEGFGQGHWQFTLPPQGTGPVEVTTIAANAAGGFISVPSDPIAFEITGAARQQELPSIESIYDSVSYQAIGQGDSTRDNTPTLSGRVNADAAKIAVFVNGALTGYAGVNVEGGWHFTLPSQSPGQVEVTIAAANAAGQLISAVSDPIAFQITDTGHREPPRVDSVYDDVAYQPIRAGGSTRDDTPTLSGRADADVVKVAVLVNGETVGYANTDSNGYWSFELPSQQSGHIEVSVAAANGAGQLISGQSNPIGFEISEAGPGKPAPYIDTIYDDVANQPIEAGGTTYDDTPALRGYVVGNDTAKVAVFVNGELAGYANVSFNASWKFQLPSQEPGEVKITVAGANAAGELISDQSSPIVFEIKDANQQSQSEPELESLDLPLGALLSANDAELFTDADDAMQTVASADPYALSATELQAWNSDAVSPYGTTAVEVAVMSVTQPMEDQAQAHSLF